MTRFAPHFAFIDIPLPGQTNSRSVLADALERATQNLFPKDDKTQDHTAESSDCTTFVVVDVRGENDRSARARAIKAAIGNLIHGTETPKFILDKDCKTTRHLLFVGSETKLAEEAKEDVLKHDLELAIRTLRSAGVATYVGIADESPGRPSEEKCIEAVLALSRRVAEYPTPSPLNKGICRARKTFRRCITFARDIPMFEFLGREDEKGHPAPYDDVALFWEISTLHQLGKREAGGRADPLPKLKKFSKTFDVPGVPDSSYELDMLSRRLLDDWAGWFGVNAKTIKNAIKDAGLFAQHVAQYRLLTNGLDPVLHTQTVAAHFKLDRYELLRDIARLMGSDGVMRLRELAPRNGEKHRKILIIDDLLYESLGSEVAADEKVTQLDPDLQRLRVAMQLIEWPLDCVHVTRSKALDHEKTLLQIVPTVNGDEAEYRTLKVSHPATLIEMPFKDYVVDSTAILIDPESRFDAWGPTRVLRLANILKERSPGLGWTGINDPDGNPESHVPRIIAFSGRTSGGYIQQCLNFGASAFCPKTRPFYLLFEMARIILRRGEKRHRHDTSLASNFRAFGSLKQHTIDSLQCREPDSLIGRPSMLPKSQGPQFDPVDEAWVKSLPKADLHTHIGTAISLPMITLLAYNTLGHCIACRPETDTLLQDLAVHIVEIRCAAAKLYKPDLPATPLACLLRAAVKLQPSPGSVPETSNPMGLGDKLIDLLAADDYFKSNVTEVSALLVLALSDHLDLSKATDIGKRIAAFSGGISVEEATDTGLDVAIKQARIALGYVLNRTAAQWNGIHTLGSVRRTVPTLGGNETAETVLSKSINAVWEKHDKVTKALKGTGLFERLESQRLFTLDEAVAARSGLKTQGDGATGLQHYLQGTDLLGSAHFQFPENIILAAHDIVHQNAADSVVYSELRCETTGYTREGMAAENATELLCRALDVASLTAARDSKTPLVRVNVILAAKRHKKKTDAARSVALYQRVADRTQRLSANGGASSGDRRLLPRWWRRSGVVGFDISGDERTDNKWLSKVLVPLNEMSAAITIHAGESESVESIWKAVYQLHARRIGHGLRLLEKNDLLQLFEEAGICVELCPYSNRLTNGFDDTDPKDAEFPRRTEYPLREYQKHGLEVTIGTDNRHIHPEGHRTLTSEYLEAARMSGGLTRWEVLQIVKAGFKNAFVSKDERRMMLAAVEERLYEIVADG